MSLKDTEAVALQPHVAPATQGGVRRRTIMAFVSLARPRQWLKNLLVFAAPGTAGVLMDGGPLASAVGAFAAFCLASSGAYCINDARDREADRSHPVKRGRPVARGTLSRTDAWRMGAALSGAGVLLALAVGGLSLMAVLIAYVALATLYSYWLKDIVAADILALAAAFFLRTVAGAVATNVYISGWFFIVACFGSVFVAAMKRRAEAIVLGHDGPAARRTLAVYSQRSLLFLSVVAAGVATAAYSVWAFQRSMSAGHPVPWFELSILPFVGAIARFAVVSDRDPRSAPEDVLLRDRPLQLAALTWLALLAAGLYVFPD